MKAHLIPAGYVTPWYTVLDDAELVDVDDEALVRLFVRHHDGGTDYKFFPPNADVAGVVSE